MFRKLALTVYLFVILFLAVVANAFTFSGYEWGHRYPVPGVGSPRFGGNTTILFFGFADWRASDTVGGSSGAWFTDDTLNNISIVNGDTLLRLKFKRGPNRYFYNPNGDTTNSNRAIYDSLNIWRAVNHSFFIQPPHREQYKNDSLKCQKFINGMRDSLVWYQSFVRTTNSFRYGRFAWEIDGNFDGIHAWVNPGLWIYDATNRGVNQFSANELDFEFCRWGNSMQNSFDFLQVTANPIKGPDTTIGPYYYDRYKRHFWKTPVNDSSRSTHSFIYKPESVVFRSEWDAYTSPDSAKMFTFLDTNRSIRGFVTDTTFSDTMVIPICGNDTRAIMSIYIMKENDSVLWANRRNGQTVDSLEMLVRSFSYTGYPDLSFRDTVGAPWPWSTNDWKPDERGRSVVTNYNDHSVNRDQIFYWRDSVWFCWGVHNSGTAIAPASPNQSIQTNLYRYQYDPETQNPPYANLGPGLNPGTDTLDVDGYYLDSLAIEMNYINFNNPTALQRYHLCIDSSLTMDELRKSNNVDTIFITLLWPDLSFKNSDLTWYVPYPQYGQETPLVCNLDSSHFNWADTTIFAIDTCYFHWAYRNNGTGNPPISSFIYTKIQDLTTSHIILNQYQRYSGENSIDNNHIQYKFPITSVGNHIVRISMASARDSLGSNYYDPIETNNYFDLTVQIVRPDSALRGSYVVDNLCPIDSGDTFKIYPTTNVTFQDSGRFLVKRGAVLEFVSRDSSHQSNDVAFLYGDSSTQNITIPRIEIESGGKVIGKHAKFENLPLAIHNYGRVMLDSVNFVECSEWAIKINSDADSVVISHSSFTDNGIPVEITGLQTYVSIDNCTFNGSSSYAIKVNSGVEGNVTIQNNNFVQVGGTVLYVSQSSIEFSNNTIDYAGIDENSKAVIIIACETAVTIDSCTLNGNGKGSGIYLEKCKKDVRITNTTVRSFQDGMSLTLSSPILVADTLISNYRHGISWSNDHPNCLGRIEGCVIRNNGVSSSGAAGFFGYACNPILVCNTFSSNNSYAVHLIGESAPSFYDPNYSMGANSFSGVTRQPLILIDKSSPVFRDGGNMFTIDNDTLSYFMKDVSTNVPTHNVTVNSFDADTSITNFYPSESKYWTRDAGLLAGECNQSMMMMGSGGDGEAFLAGDHYFFLEQLDSAMISYQTALTLSGDTTAIGSAALNRISKLNPELPAVGDPLVSSSLYNASYGYDAIGDFSSADAKRDSILMMGNGNDSLRIEYDMSVSMLLRPTTMAMGQGAEIAQERARNHRRELLDKLSGVKTRSTETTQRLIPETFKLYPVYPNPFNPTTNIRVDIPKSTHIKVLVYDYLGRLVTTVANKEVVAGRYTYQWNGNSVASGVYFVMVKTPEFSHTRKMVLMK